MNDIKTFHYAALDRANHFIEKYGNNINERYRPYYHLAAVTGWINDPNGFGWYNGKMHQFYQYNPYGSVWGPMHWGHAVSKDMVKWENLPVALAPSEPYDDDSGCFSGSSIVVDNKFCLMYTGMGKGMPAQQCAAVSEDGVKFYKYENNPVISPNELPACVSAEDCRDPFIYKRDGKYYCLLGTKSGGFGNIAMFRSDDLKKWSFVGLAFDESQREYVSRGVCECPSRALLNGKEVLIYSPQYMPNNGSKFRNIHSSVYIVGSFNYETGAFTGGEIQDIDSGFDFYAPQVTVHLDGRTVMTAWMQMWDRNIPTAQDGWSGAMILTRQISLDGERLVQLPVRELENYLADEQTCGDMTLYNEVKDIDCFRGDCSEIVFTLKKGDANRAGIEFFKGNSHRTYLYYHAHSGRIVLDRVRSGIDIRGAENEEIYWKRSVEAPAGEYINFRILLDNTSAEIFIGDGKSVMTANVYADESDDGVAFFADGGTAGIIGAKKYTIKI